MAIETGGEVLLQNTLDGVVTHARMVMDYYTSGGTLLANQKTSVQAITFLAANPSTGLVMDGDITFTIPATVGGTPYQYAEVKAVELTESTGIQTFAKATVATTIVLFDESAPIDQEYILTDLTVNFGTSGNGAVQLAAIDDLLNALDTAMIKIRLRGTGQLTAGGTDTVYTDFVTLATGDLTRTDNQLLLQNDKLFNISVGTGYDRKDFNIVQLYDNSETTLYLSANLNTTYMFSGNGTFTLTGLTITMPYTV